MIISIIMYLIQERKDLQMDEFNQALFLPANTRFHMMYEKAKEDKTFKTDMAEEEFMS